MTDTKPTVGEKAAEFMMSTIGDRYLRLIRENYLSAPATEQPVREFLADSLRSVVDTGRFSCVRELAESDDWREAVVGLHYAIVLASPAFNLAQPKRPLPKAYQNFPGRLGAKYGERLLAGGTGVSPLTARPAFLLLALLNRRNVIVDFLAAAKPEIDSAEVYAAALVGEELTRQSGSGPAEAGFQAASACEHALTLLRRREWHDEKELTASKEKFARSWDYWTKPTRP